MRDWRTLVAAACVVVLLPACGSKQVKVDPTEVDPAEQEQMDQAVQQMQGLQELARQRAMQNAPQPAPAPQEQGQEQ